MAGRKALSHAGIAGFPFLLESQAIIPADVWRVGQINITLLQVCAAPALPLPDHIYAFPVQQIVLILSRAKTSTGRGHVSPTLPNPDGLVLLKQFVASLLHCGTLGADSMSYLAYGSFGK